MSETEFTQLLKTVLYSIKCASFHYWLKGYPADEAILKVVEVLTRKDDKDE